VVVEHQQMLVVELVELQTLVAVAAVAMVDSLLVMD
jgi:hypothetical protein